MDFLDYFYTGNVILYRLIIVFQAVAEIAQNPANQTTSPNV